MIRRCDWAGSDPLNISYHDNEWGVPVYDDRKLFEFLILEGMQAGLSWLTILKKRENFRKAFDNFDPVKISRYDQTKQEKLLQNERIIRNRLKINAVVKNATAFLKIQEEYGSFSKYIWEFTGGKPLTNRWQNVNDIPARTTESDKMSTDLKKRGFTFVGSTICYAFMQAVGMVNDHITDCYRYSRLRQQK